MYQFKVTTHSPLKELLNLYEDIASTGLTNEDGSGNTNRILLEFIGERTNWNRTVITYIGGAFPRNSRSWTIGCEVWKTNWLTIIDTEAQRKAGSVFLPQPEIYTINFYYQASTTNLDISNATKINLTARLNTERVVDDPYNQAPVSAYTEYTDNDLTDGSNENMQYGINS
jgi:hypothetical protein